MNELKNILSPITVKNVEIPNRVVMPPMGTNLGNADGTVSEATIAYLKRRAKGGPGLIITEIVAAHSDGIAINTQLGAYDDRFIPGLAKLVALAHEAGNRIFMQIHHAGRESLHMLSKGKAVGPSAIPSLIYRIPPREMTIDDIKETIAAFGSAAGRAREAGFDGVELHCAHGYLLTQFLSTLSNQRTDEYGGATLKQRSRFVIEVIQMVRKEVGADFPISIRISTEEFIKGGYTADDMQTILPDFVSAGVDIIHASFGTHGSPGGITSAPIEYAPGFNSWLARKVKDVVDVPVIAVGRFNDPALADEVIKRGDADLVAFGRQFLADPDFLIKAREGRTEDIRKCLACNQGCIERLILGEGNIRCAINPETGQETIYPEGPAANPKDVWIVGGGPAGLTAAFEAARLGHTVTLYESAEELGGQIQYARRPPHKEAYGDWIDWLIGQVKKAGITIKISTEVTPAMVREEKPEAVILAAGGEKITPEIPGIGGSQVCDAWQVLSGAVKPGENVLVIGGGLIGMETADYLSEQGSKVTLVEMLKRSPVQKITSHGYMLHKRLRDKNALLLFSTTVTSIGDGSAEIETAGEASTVSPIDQVVVAVGLKPRDGLTEVLTEEGIPCTVVGDASSARRIIEATEEGARAAWEL
ncbi:MAG: FAD-dependent oxidoreductase [Deltaproteobacteria bacterium]|nr:FAD-dependent oxidoreductase [Deltaproteobacteria bacterium]